MFTPSTIAISAAAQEIADSGGASADAEMTNRAGKSLFAAIKFFNGRQDWRWLLTEGSPIQVTGPFTFGITASAGQVTATLSAGHGVQPDDFIVGSGFSIGTRVSSTAATSATFNRAITGWTSGAQNVSVTANRDFYDLPSDWRKPYVVKLLTARKVLIPAPRRAYDRATYDEFQGGATDWYDLFAGFQKGKIRLLGPPTSADTMFLRYYRRMTVPTTTATADVLDIPQDYDSYLIAWGKWHFLTDKGNPERAQTWLSLATDGLKIMISDQGMQPDESLAFGDRSPYNFWDITSTRNVPGGWEYT